MYFAIWGEGTNYYARLFEHGAIDEWSEGRSDLYLEEVTADEIETEKWIKNTRIMVSDMMSDPDNLPKDISQFIRDLKASGEPIDLDGYFRK